MKLEVFDDADSVARQAAAAIAADARARSPPAAAMLAVSGGHTPWIMLRALANEDVPWAGVHIFQVDERVAPDGRSGSKPHAFARKFPAACLRCVPEHVHAMPVESADLERRRPAVCARPPGDRWIAAGAGSGPPRSRSGRPHRLAGAGRSGAQYHGRRRRESLASTRAAAG